MDVTKETFPAVSGQVIDFIKTCDFYAVDCELTGVMVPSMPEGLCDTPERNYALKGTAATRYSIIQFGVCTFHRDPKDPKNFITRPFNFFLFPSEHPHHLGGYSDRTLERDLILNPGAISFNRRFKMDFQKWIYHGVEYCNGPLERKMEEFLDREAAADALKKTLAADREVSVSMLSSADEKQYFDKCEAMAKEFVKEVSAEEASRRPKELMLPSTKSRTAREVTMGYLEATYSPKLLVAQRGRFPNRDLCLVRVSADEMAKLRERTDTLRSRRLLDFVGFRTIFKAMVEAKKPIVGHNCLVDLLFMQTAFDEPLDLSSLQAYKKHFHEQFPLVFDTKAIAVNTDYFAEDRFESKSLEPLFTTLNDKPPQGVVMPTFSLPLGFQAYEEITMMKAKGQGNSSAHEAGYDAMMTGQVLLKLLTEAKVLDFSDRPSNKQQPIATTAPSSAPLPQQRENKSSSAMFDSAAAAFGNYIHLHRSLYLLDVQTIDEAKELVFEGGVSDVFTATNGVVLITYKKERILAHHMLESQVRSIGFEGCSVLEVIPGIAILVLTEKAVEDICIRNKIPSTYTHPPTTAAAAASKKDGKGGAPWCHFYYSNPPAVAAAVEEINAKFGGSSGNVTAEIFIPYHARRKDGSSITQLQREAGAAAVPPADGSTRKKKAAASSAVAAGAPPRKALGECTHPSIAAAAKGEPSPFNLLPPEVLAAAGLTGSGAVLLNPLAPAVLAATDASQRRTYHTASLSSAVSFGGASPFALAPLAVTSSSAGRGLQLPSALSLMRRVVRRR